MGFNKKKITEQLPFALTSTRRIRKLASNHYIFGNEKLAWAIQTYDVYDLNNFGSRQLKHFWNKRQCPHKHSAWPITKLKPFFRMGQKLWLPATIERFQRTKNWNLSYDCNHWFLESIQTYEVDSLQELKHCLTYRNKDHCLFFRGLKARAYPIQTTPPLICRAWQFERTQPAQPTSKKATPC